MIRIMITYMNGDINKKWWGVVAIRKIAPKAFNQMVIFLLNQKCRQQKKKFWNNDFSKVPLFKQVEIETVNVCNNDCSFCPVSVNNDKRERKKMTNELFEKIINELSSLDYSGIVNLFSNNEPLIDERIVSFAELTRKKVPKSKINFYTNGKLLTESKFEELVKYVDYMQIDNYSDEMKVQENLQFVIDACKHNKELDHKVNICVMKKTQIRSSRGGNAPNKNNLKSIKARCILPLHEMTIRPDGLVSLCCNDAYGQITIGDVNKQGLVEIWESESYKKYREKIFESRENVDVCKFCDSVDFGRDKFWSKI